jgi:hypothetical protein
MYRHLDLSGTILRHADLSEDGTSSSGHLRGGHKVDPDIRTSRRLCVPLSGMRTYQRRLIPSSKPLRKGVSSSGLIRSGRAVSSGPHQNFLWVWRTRSPGPFYSRHPDLLMEKGLCFHWMKCFVIRTQDGGGEKTREASPSGCKMRFVLILTH